MSKIIKPEVMYVAPNEGYFKIPKVEFQGEIHTYQLYDKMTNSMNQDDLAKISREQKELGNPYSIGLSQFMAICKALCKSKNADALNSVHNGLKNYPIFLSRVIYNPFPSEDKTIHEYVMPDEYFLNGDIVGDDDLIEKINNKKSLELLTGIKSFKTLNKISNSITSTPMYHWRLNSKPSKKQERVVHLYAVGVGLFLVASGDLSVVYPAFRVLQVD